MDVLWFRKTRKRCFTTSHAAVDTNTLPIHVVRGKIQPGGDIFGENKLLVSRRADPIVTMLKRHTLQKANLVLVNNSYLTQFFEKAYQIKPSMISTQPWGIPIEDWECAPDELPIAKNIKNNIDADEIIFLSYRSARPEYRIHVLPFIHRSLQDAGVKYHFIYCLRGSRCRNYADRIISRSKLLGTHGNSTFFTKPLCIDELKNLLNLSDYSFSIPK